MTLFDWLASPIGLEFTHALIFLIVAVAGWISYQNRQHIGQVSQKLDSHIADTKQFRAESAAPPQLPPQAP
jgi:hypothetical protein